MRPLALLLTALLHREDARLIRQSLAGRGDALRVLVRRLMPVIRARVRRRLGRSDAAEDVAQEIWVALFDRGGRALRAFDPSRGGTLEGYVGMVAERRLVDHLRRTHAEKRGLAATAADPEAVASASDPTADPEAAAMARHLAAALGGHLEASLPGMGLLVMRLIYTDGHAPGQVASILGVNLQVVYNWQHRIRREATAFLATQG